MATDMQFEDLGEAMLVNPDDGDETEGDAPLLPICGHCSREPYAEPMQHGTDDDGKPQWACAVCGQTATKLVVEGDLLVGYSIPERVCGRCYTPADPMEVRRIVELDGWDPDTQSGACPVCGLADGPFPTRAELLQDGDLKWGDEPMRVVWLPEPELEELPPDRLLDVPVWAPDWAAVRGFAEAALEKAAKGEEGEAKKAEAKAGLPYLVYASEVHRSEARCHWGAAKRIRDMMEEV